MGREPANRKEGRTSRFHKYLKEIDLTRPDGRSNCKNNVDTPGFSSNPINAKLTFSEGNALDDKSEELLKKSALYKEFLAEREEILRHKWLESEKAGHDIGFERALLDWIVKHRSSWRRDRVKKTA